MKKRHIIWDWNGTLLDDTQASVNSINVLLVRRGVPTIDVSRYRDIFGFPVIDFYRQIRFPLESENWDRVAREYHDVFLADTTFKLQSGTLEALSLIRKIGIGQSVLSASEQSILNQMLSAYGIRDYFSHVCGVDNLYGHSKVDVGQKLVSQFNMPKASILLVGDTLHDVEVAHALGVSPVLIAQGHQSRERLSQAGVPLFEDLDAFCCSLH
jgi:phosphoglycolate phosphatase